MLALESTDTMFPGPLAEAMGCLRGTNTGDTKTDSLSPSEESMAVPSSLMVERIILAYSKSTAVKDEMPLHWIYLCEYTHIIHAYIKTFVFSVHMHISEQHAKDDQQQCDTAFYFNDVLARILKHA